MTPLPTVTTSPLSSSSTSGSSTTSPAPDSKTKKYLRHFTSGLGSGGLSAFLLQPADLLKTRLQQAPALPNGRPATITSTMRTILSGPKPMPTLWRGAVPSVIRTSFGSALYFTTLSMVRDAMATPTQRSMSEAAHNKGSHSSVLVQISPVNNMLSGAVSRASVGFVMMPVTILKVRFESDLYAYRSLAGAAGSIWKHEGIAGFFRGWGATAVRDAPYAGIFFVFYEAGKKSLSNMFMTDEMKREKRDNRSLGVNMAASALAAMAATTLTNPFDMLKTRLQVLPGEYKNMWVALGRVVREEGAKKLFNGLSLRIGRKAVSSALVWPAYEYLISRAKGENPGGGGDKL